MTVGRDLAHVGVGAGEGRAAVSLWKVPAFVSLNSLSLK